MQFSGALVVALATVLLAEEPPELRTSIRLLTPRPKLGDPIFVEVLVRNVGLEPLLLNSEMGPRNGLVFVIVDPSGERLPLLGPIVCGYGGTVDAVKLEAFFKFGTDVEIGKRYRFTRPGTYEVSVAYVLTKPRSADYSLVRSSTISFYVSGISPQGSNAVQ